MAARQSTWSPMSTSRRTSPLLFQHGKTFLLSLDFLLCHWTIFFAVGVFHKETFFTDCLVKIFPSRKKIHVARRRGVGK